MIDWYHGNKRMNGVTDTTRLHIMKLPQSPLCRWRRRLRMPPSWRLNMRGIGSRNKYLSRPQRLLIYTEQQTGLQPCAMDVVE
jgi:hypothetical protein